jgi:hypothetical protein
MKISLYACGPPNASHNKIKQGMHLKDKANIKNLNRVRCSIACRFWSAKGKIDKGKIVDVDKMKKLYSK